MTTDNHPKTENTRVDVSEAEKREHPRKQFTLTVDLTRGQTSSTNQARDISLSGIFVETSDDFSPGQEVELSIPFSNLDRRIRMKGKVARVSDAGIGVQFDIYSIDIE